MEERYTKQFYVGKQTQQTTERLTGLLDQINLQMSIFENQPTRQFIHSESRPNTIEGTSQGYILGQIRVLSRNLEGNSIKRFSPTNKTLVKENQDTRTYFDKISEETMVDRETPKRKRIIKTVSKKQNRATNTYQAQPKLPTQQMKDDQGQGVLQDFLSHSLLNIVEDQQVNENLKQIMIEQRNTHISPVIKIIKEFAWNQASQLVMRQKQLFLEYKRIKEPLAQKNPKSAMRVQDFKKQLLCTKIMDKQITKIFLVQLKQNCVYRRAVRDQVEQFISQQNQILVKCVFISLILWRKESKAKAIFLSELRNHLDQMRLNRFFKAICSNKLKNVSQRAKLSRLIQRVYFKTWYTIYCRELFEGPLISPLKQDDNLGSQYALPSPININRNLQPVSIQKSPKQTNQEYLVVKKLQFIESPQKIKDVKQKHDNQPTSTQQEPILLSLNKLRKSIVLSQRIENLVRTQNQRNLKLCFQNIQQYEGSFLKLKGIFTVWKQSHRIRKLRQAVGQVFKLNRMTSVFNSWRVMHDQYKLKVQRQGRLAFLQYCFKGWKKIVFPQYFVRAMISTGEYRAQNYYRANRVVKAFLSWKKSSRQERGGRLMIKNLKRSLLLSVVGKWRLGANREKRKERLALKLRSNQLIFRFYINGNLIIRCFNVLREQRNVEKLIKQVRCRKVFRMLKQNYRTSRQEQVCFRRNLMIRITFTKLRNYSRINKQKDRIYKSVQLINRYKKQQKMKKILRFWQEYSVNRQQKQQIYNRMKNLYQQSVKILTFKKFKFFTRMQQQKQQQTQLAYMIADSAPQPQIGVYFRALKEKASDSRNYEIMEMMADKIHKVKLLKKIMRFWRQQVDYGRMVQMRSRDVSFGYQSPHFGHKRPFESLNQQLYN